MARKVDRAGLTKTAGNRGRDRFGAPRRGPLFYFLDGVGANMAETPKLEILDVQPIILKLEGPFFGIRVHTKDAQYPEIDLVVQRRFLSSLKDEIIEMLKDFPEQAED
ncbi:MAG TPA: hypothetical protein VE970_03740 [Pseudolabrys sp.]|nr:hypothetical protein [Pseudolabrys sp.]